MALGSKAILLLIQMIIRSGVESVKPLPPEHAPKPTILSAIPRLGLSV